MKCENCLNFFRGAVGKLGYCRLFKCRSDPEEGCTMGRGAEHVIKPTQELDLPPMSIPATLKAKPEPEAAPRAYLKTSATVKKKKFLLPVRWEA